jgi:hypothetical protein
MPNPSTDQLQRALKISEQIQKLEAELATILGNAVAAKTKRAYTKRAISDVAAPPSAAAPAKKKRKKAKMSPEGLANIIAAQKKRWAKVRKEAKKE